ncbi:hypothetical protein BZG36_02606 [Bifiguratus adelaidae]|uniref:Uncharacterized protein n=1 Tax=Bifiguratus adelaidae TaxID=1938954 RepID=A0A261Y2M6_9FUNG|nr:hypothetical protein BZG36_02606 [Bifiguratus adelaidae]
MDGLDAGEIRRHCLLAFRGIIPRLASGGFPQLQPPVPAPFVESESELEDNDSMDDGQETEGEEHPSPEQRFSMHDSHHHPSTTPILPRPTTNGAQDKPDSPEAQLPSYAQPIDQQHVQVNLSLYDTHSYPSQAEKQPMEPAYGPQRSDLSIAPTADGRDALLTDILEANRDLTTYDRPDIPSRTSEQVISIDAPSPRYVDQHSTSGTTDNEQDATINDVPMSPSAATITTNLPKSPSDYILITSNSPQRTFDEIRQSSGSNGRFFFSPSPSTKQLSDASPLIPSTFDLSSELQKIQSFVAQDIDYSKRMVELVAESDAEGHDQIEDSDNDI